MSQLPQLPSHLGLSGAWAVSVQRFLDESGGARALWGECDQANRTLGGCLQGSEHIPVGIAHPLGGVGAAVTGLCAEEGSLQMVPDDALAGQGVLTAAVFEGSELGFKRLLAVRNEGGQNPFHAAGAQRKAGRVERLGRDGSLEVDTGKSVYLKIKQSGEGGSVHAGVAKHRKCCSSNRRQTAQKNAAASGQRFFEISALETAGWRTRLS